MQALVDGGPRASDRMLVVDSFVSARNPRIELAPRNHLDQRSGDVHLVQHGSEARRCNRDEGAKTLDAGGEEGGVLVLGEEPLGIAIVGQLSVFVVQLARGAEAADLPVVVVGAVRCAAADVCVFGAGVDTAELDATSEVEREEVRLVVGDVVGHSAQVKGLVRKPADRRGELAPRDDAGRLMGRVAELFCPKTRRFVHRGLLLHFGELGT